MKQGVESGRLLRIGATEAGGSEDELKRLLSEATPWVATESDGDDGRDDQKVKRENRFIDELEGELKLFHTPNRVAYAVFHPHARSDGSGLVYEIARIKDSPFESWLQGLYYKKEGKPASDQIMRGFLNLLEAKAVHDSPECKC